MHRLTRNRPAAFTLIELLTVVAIIALLIGIVVPSINAVRKQAKKTATKNLQTVLAKGCELYHGDFDAYPRSAGFNPFEGSGSGVYLSGAQWLLLELGGADLAGNVRPDADHYYDTDGNGTINQQDWLDAYDVTKNGGMRRFGPYITSDDDTMMSPERLRQRTGVVLPGALRESGDGANGPGTGTGGGSVWNNYKLAFAVDAFNCPVVYYRAAPQAKLPFSGPGSNNPGRYDQRDNAALTGSQLTSPTEMGIDLGRGEVGTLQNHWLFSLGWNVSNPNQRPAGRTFAGQVYDEKVFGGGTTGKVWPRNPDSFLLISAGPDLIYGTGDDITNY